MSMQQLLPADATSGDVGDTSGGIEGFDGSIEAAAGGGSNTGNGPGSGGVSTGGPNGVGGDSVGSGTGTTGTGTGPGGSGGNSAVDVSQLGLSSQMQFSRGDAQALVAAVGTLGTAIGTAVQGNPGMAAWGLASAIALDLSYGDPVGVALAHMEHDGALGLQAGLAQAAANLAAAPVSVLGLYGTVAMNTVDATISVDSGDGFAVNFSMLGGPLTVYVYPPDPFQVGVSSGGNGPQ